MRHSESIKEIAAALTEFQSEIKDPSRDGENPHFRSKYVQIDGLLAAVRPVLAKHGLSIVQSTGGNGQDISVSTMLLHKSGEWIETDALMIKPAKADPQGCMSAITYSRRYSLSAALGVAWDDDDDGNEASTPLPKPKAAPKAKAKAGIGNKDMKQASQQSQSNESKAALKLIVQEGMAHGVKPEDFSAIIKMRYQKASSSQLTDDEVNDLAENYMKYMSHLVGG